MQDRKLVGIGIDLVSRKRIERFLSEHPFESIKRLLTPGEQERFQTAASPRDFFARSFAAKEAYFKAAGGAGMGASGFRGIEIIMEGKERFYARHPEARRAEGSQRSFASLRTTPGLPPRNDERVEGRFFTTPDGLGAQVLLYKK